MCLSIYTSVQKNVLQLEYVAQQTFYNYASEIHETCLRSSNPHPSSILLHKYAVFDTNLILTQSKMSVTLQFLDEKLTEGLNPKIYQNLDRN